MFPKKQKTFHGPIPVCSCCQAVRVKSISCSKCRQMCCMTCLGLSGEVFSSNWEEVLVTLLTNRTCVRCKTGSDAALPQLPVAGGELVAPIIVEAHKQGEGEEPEATITVVSKCADHGKVRKLFCLTCSQLLCGDCFDSGERHARHIINNVNILYQEKRDLIERKLEQVTGEVRILEKETGVCRENLAAIEERKQTVLSEVDRVNCHTKAEIDRLTADCITALKGQIDRADQRQKDVTALQGLVQQLHPEDFLKQCPDIHRQCDELLASSTANGCTPAQTENIGCELVPPFRLVTFKLDNFNGSTQWLLSLVTQCDVYWEGRVQKAGENITVQCWPRDPQFKDFKHELLVVVPHHQDISKEVRKTFDQSKEETIFSVEHCVQQGFIGGQNDLTIKVGVRPTNALIKNKLLEKQYDTLKIKHSEVEKQLLTMTTTHNTQTTKIYNVESQLLALKNSFDYKFLTMWFAPSMQGLYYGTLVSYPIIDRDGRSWCLYVKQTVKYTEQSSIEAHVSLEAGSPTWCRYFIGLEHQTDPTKNVRMSGTSYFDSPSSHFGWNNFISKQVLQADLGYRASGKLNFCIGVQPRSTGVSVPRVVPPAYGIFGISVANP